MSIKHTLKALLYVIELYFIYEMYEEATKLITFSFDLA